MRAMENSWKKKLKRNRCNRALGELARSLRKHQRVVKRKTASVKRGRRSSKLVANCKARAGKIRVLVNKCLRSKNVRKCMEGIQRKHERPMKKAGCGPEADQIGKYAESRTRSIMSKRKGSKGKFCRQHKMMAMQRVGKCARGKSSKSKRACVNRMVIKQKWFRTFKQRCRGEGDDVDDHIENKIK